MGLNHLLINNYPMYGLNYHRRFMRPPMEDGEVILETKEDVQDFCTEVLTRYDCEAAGIFCVFRDGSLMAMWKITENDDCAIVEAEGTDLHFFAEIDGVFRLCCYNLMIETADGRWTIQ